MFVLCGKNDRCVDFIDGFGWVYSKDLKVNGGLRVKY